MDNKVKIINVYIENKNFQNNFKCFLRTPGSLKKQSKLI